MTKSEPKARVLLDSVSKNGNRLTSIEVTLHRFMLPEFNTHRVFSRNSASSRAIPLPKQIEYVISDPAIPVIFPGEQRGMQGGEEIDKHDEALELWLTARDEMVQIAWEMHELGVHKSVVNRLLEPFMWQTIIVTATDWDGFWEQRCSPLAQPEIKEAADAMREAYMDSTPTEVDFGDWHTPLIQPDEDEAFWNDYHGNDWEIPKIIELRKRVSAARCARVSYLTHDGQRSLDADLTLYERLATADPPHWSPMEHVATPYDQRVHSKQLGNFQGWIQMRHIKECTR